MHTSAARHNPSAIDVRFGADAFQVALADGRELSIPLEWFPRLRDATPARREELMARDSIRVASST